MDIASNSPFLLLLCFLALFHGRTFSLTLPLTKDAAATSQYIATVHHGSPIKPTHLALDLGGPSLWIACGPSTSARTIPSRSIQCAAAATGSPRSALHGGACEVLALNRFGGLQGKSLLVQDTVPVRSSDRSTAAEVFALHSCAPRFLLQGLAKSAKGVLGLGRNQISLPTQIATELGFYRRFSVCLSSTNGVVVLDSESQYSVYGSEILNSLTYTPILTNQIHGSESPEYFINVKAIKVNGNRLDLGGGGGGARLSTVVAYTKLESSIYKYVTAAFRAEMKVKEVAPVAPFGACFAAEMTENVPEIELILQSEMVRWKMNGRNSMVKVKEDVMCLALVDGGLNPENDVVLGGYQMEDIVLHFDLGTSMLGFTSSLLNTNRSCSQFSADKTD